jgi:hypothetical protein
MRMFFIIVLTMLCVEVFAQQQSLTGVYGYVRHGKKMDLSTGRIDVIQLSDRKIKYQLNVNTFRDHLGSATGILGVIDSNNDNTKLHTIRYIHSYDSCKLTFIFYGDTLRIDQEGDYWDCHFGHGVYADGVYVKAKKAKPILDGWGITVDNNGYDYTVKAEKATFYQDSSLTSPTYSFLIKGDKISSTSLAPQSEKSVYVEYYNSKKVIFTYGWISLSDLEEIR